MSGRKAKTEVRLYAHASAVSDAQVDRLLAAIRVGEVTSISPSLICIPVGSFDGPLVVTKYEGDQDFDVTFYSSEGVMNFACATPSGATAVFGQLQLG